MRFDHLHIHQHLNRREALGLGVAAATAAGLAALPSGPASASGPALEGRDGRDGRGHGGGTSYDDEMFDPQDVIDGAWVPSAYGPGDERGTFNELTPEKAGDALGLLRRGRPVNTYQVGEAMFNGFPAYPSTPPRLHDMFLYILGYEPPTGFEEAGGIVAGTVPAGPNLLTGHEERFAENYTFQIGTQLDGLGHVGVGDMYYNGFRALDLVSATGLRHLGNETMGPVVTRGVVYDVVGLKIAQGHSEDLEEAPNRQPMLAGTYRITIDDLRACLDRQRIRREIGPGDIPLIHTGWTHLAVDAPDRYLAGEPGIYLAEARYFADRRVALIATDAWGLETVNPDVTEGNVFPCHQELFGKYGVRIGEGFVTDAAIADHVYEGVLVITPQNVPGATAGSTPPVLLGQPGRPIRD